MIINLAYGKKGYSIEVSDNYNIDIIEPKWIESVSDQSLSITAALRMPYNSKPLKELVCNTDKIAIIFSDITRATPYNIILPALLNELQHIPQKNISFFCANGTHRLVTDPELINILGENIFKNYEIVQNDASNSDMHRYAGTTSSGNELFLNSKLLSAKSRFLQDSLNLIFLPDFRVELKL